MQKPSYMKEEEEEKPKEQKKIPTIEEEKKDEDEVDFEREEEDDDDERANVQEEDDESTQIIEKKSPHTVIKRTNNNQIKVKVNINVSNLTKAGKTKKSPQKKDQISPEQKEQMTNYLLDMLFSFIGVSSQECPNELKMTQSTKLNLFTTRSYQSRSTALSPNMPREISNELIEVDMNEPELLPVSCGYFYNIVRQLLLK